MSSATSRIVLLTMAAALAASCALVGCGRKEQPQPAAVATLPDRDVAREEASTALTGPQEPAGEAKQREPAAKEPGAAAEPTKPDKPQEAEAAPDKTGKSPPKEKLPNGKPASKVEPKRLVAEKPPAPPPAPNVPEAPEAIKAEEPEGTTVVGKIKLVSNVPDPSTVTYKECVTFIKYEVESVESGDYDGGELIAVFWGMRKSKLQPPARFSAGQRHRLTIQPLSERPELERVMRADDTQDYSLTPYWVVSYAGQ